MTLQRPEGRKEDGEVASRPQDDEGLLVVKVSGIFTVLLPHVMLHGLQGNRGR